jgi:hypothetical protein
MTNSRAEALATIEAHRVHTMTSGKCSSHIDKGRMCDAFTFATLYVEALDEIESQRQLKDGALVANQQVASENVSLREQVSFLEKVRDEALDVNRRNNEHWGSQLAKTRQEVKKSEKCAKDYHQMYLDVCEIADSSDAALRTELAAAQERIKEME